MADDRLRELERHASSDPSDALLQDELLRARVRAGLGWNGKELPEASCGCKLRNSDEKNVYELRLHPKDRQLVTLQLVYVPGGNLACLECRGDGFHRYLNGGSSGSAACEICAGTGTVKIDPFLIGRLPIMWKDWMTFGGIPAHVPFDRIGWTEELEQHPAFNVSHNQAGQFCHWAGGRLPTAIEWKWAAFGAPEPGYGKQKNLCKKCGGGGRYSIPTGGFGIESIKCEACRATGKVQPKQYPWGDEKPSHELMNVHKCSNEECIGGGVLGYDRQFAGGCDWCHGSGLESAESTAPCVKLRCDRWPLCDSGHIGVKGDRSGHAPRLVPERLAGASWCGAIDLVGQTYEWLDWIPGVNRSPCQSGEVGGFGFRGEADAGRTHMIQECYTDHGFRIAMSIPS